MGAAMASVGHFGDARREAVGEELVERAVSGGTLVLRKLAKTRADEVSYQRFLSAEQVTVEEMLATAARHTAQAARGSRVLVPQDTSEVNFGARRQKPQELGPGTDGKGPALFVQGAVAVDCDADAVLGVVHAEIWTRDGERPDPRHKRAQADKESQRWLTGAQAAADLLSEAREVIVVADREADIYTFCASQPAGVELVVRARHDRKLSDGSRLRDRIADWPALDRAQIALTPKSPGAKGRLAQVELRAGRVELVRPTSADRDVPATLAMNVVEVREVDPPAGAEPVCWRLLTTLAVDTPEDAREAADIYRKRWRIEQVFRAMKRHGVNLEESQAERRDHLFKLSAIALIAGVRTLQLVDARDGSHRPASDLLEAELLPLAEAIGRRLEGRTARQQNPHPKYSLAWLSWIVARCGGWHGYYKPPGPKTMRDGWDKFAAKLQGYAQALDDFGYQPNPRIP